MTVKLKKVSRSATSQRFEDSFFDNELDKFLWKRVKSFQKQKSDAECDAELKGCELTPAAVELLCLVEEFGDEVFREALRQLVRLNRHRSLSPDELEEEEGLRLLRAFANLPKASPAQISILAFPHLVMGLSTRQISKQIALLLGNGNSIESAAQTNRAQLTRSPYAIVRLALKVPPRRRRELFEVVRSQRGFANDSEIDLVSSKTMVIDMLTAFYDGNVQKRRNEVETEQANIDAEVSPSSPW